MRVSATAEFLLVDGRAEKHIRRSLLRDHARVSTRFILSLLKRNYLRWIPTICARANMVLEEILRLPVMIAKCL